jgi:PAS domain S-box-containing protein
MVEESQVNRIPRLVVAAFAVMFLVSLAGGVWFYRTQERYLLDGVEGNLESIANLKVAQIAKWRSERLAQADEILDRPFTRDVIIPWMVSPRDDVTESILSWFRSLQKHYKYHDVMLVNVDGLPQMSSSGRTALLDSETLKAIGTALRERRCVLTDLHTDPAGLGPHLESIVPLFSGNGQTPEPIGALIQHIDPLQFLYPLIDSWPTASRSAETLLVRRDGDAVLFLNDLRHRRDTALKHRIPLSRNDVPAVMAVLGREGVVDGKDYRGIEVLSVLKAVPDSPWFMVAKIDKAEILAGWRSLSFVILVSILGLLAAVAAALGMTWQHYAKAHYRLLFQSEAALRKSEARYATTVMSIGDGVIATDAVGRVELLNPIAEALTGWRQEEARGKAVQEVFRIVNQETRRSVENPVDRVLREGVIVGLANHTLLLARDGTEHPIADSGAPIRSDKGDITGVALVFRDQSEELAVLNELRESEDKYRNLYDEAPVGYVELDCEGRIDRVNRKMLEMLGYAAEEMMGEHMWNFVVEKSEAEGAIRAKLSGYERPSEALERTYKRKDGPPIPVLIKDRVARNSEGSVTRIRVTVQDITERKQMEEEIRRASEDLKSQNYELSMALESLRKSQEALAESEQRYRIMGEILPYGVWLCDADGRAEYVSRSFLELLNMSMEEMKGFGWSSRLVPEDVPGMMEKWLGCVRTGTMWDDEHRIIDRHGRIFTILTRGLPVRDKAGNITSWAGINLDITERKQMEEELRRSRDELELRVRERTAELERKNRELQEFAFVASHDLSEPLRKIQTFGSLLETKSADRLDEQSRGYVSRMTGAANRMQELLDALLRYSRIETQGRDLVPLKLEDIVQTVTTDLEVSIRKIGAHVEIGPLPIITGDPYQWRQLFQNLIANAVKYHRAEVDTVVKVYGEEYSGTAHIFVEDNGIGFDEQYLDKVFQAFQRLHGRNEYPGTGIGLAICRRIVERHGGTITAKSTPGKGSTFIVTLPVEGTKAMNKPE